MRKRFNLSFLKLTTVVALMALCCFQKTYAQEGDADTDKRSKIIKVIDGKKYYFHIVEKGQTVYNISKIYNTSVSDIILENPDAINGVRYGMVLRLFYDPNKIIAIDGEDKIEGDFIIHKIAKGETLYAVAKKFNTTVEKIAEVNDMTQKQMDVLREGQSIKVPKPDSFEVLKNKAVPSTVDTLNKATTAKTVLAKGDVIKDGVIIHTIEHGENLGSIAKKYSTTTKAIISLNEMTPDQVDHINAGQEIKVPKPQNLTIQPMHKVSATPVIDTLVKHSTKPNAIKTTSITTVPKVPVNTANKGTGENTSTSTSAAKFGYPGAKKEEYRIAFFLPFKSSETINMTVEKLLRNEEQFSMKTKIALDFYEGALLAIDSLKKMHLNAKIFVYDIDENDSTGIYGILKNPELTKMDLIIGPLFSSDFQPIATFAKRHSIPIVSPFIQANKILFDNPYVCKVTASNSLQIVQMANFVVDSFHSQNIILVNNDNKKEQELCKIFKSVAKETVANKMYDLHDSIKDAKGINGIEKYLDSTRLNIVVLPSNNQSYVTEFTNKLHSLEKTYKFVVFGLQSWMDYDNLDYDYLNNLSLHVVSNNYINYNDPATKLFLKKFTSTYNTFPEIYAFSGYDITFYFVNMLKTYGSGFLNQIADADYKGLISNMQFIKSANSKSGFENRYVLMLQYKNYELKPVN